MPIATSGTSFRTVVTTCTQPAARTPRQFTSVSSQTTASVTITEAPFTLTIQGATTLE